MKFSEKLEQLRKSKGMSQEALAQKLNVTRQTVSKWELEQTSPDMNKLVEISKLFNVSLDELVSDVGTNSAENATYKESAVEKNNRKISGKILIVGALICCILCAIGFFRQKQAEKTNEKAYNDAYALSQSRVEEANKRLQEIVNEMNNLSGQVNDLNTEISNMTNEKSKIFQEDRGFSDRYYAKDNEINEKQAEVRNLTAQYNSLYAEKSALESDDYTGYYDLVKPIKYMIFYYIAGGVLAVTILIALVYFLVTRKK